MTAFFLVAVLTLRTFVAEPFSIPSKSMHPTLKTDDYIVVLKLGYGNYDLFDLNVIQTPLLKTIERGDVMVFDFPPNPKLEYIKRIIGLPGDRITMEGKSLFINGVEAQTELAELSGQKQVLVEIIDNNHHRIAYNETNNLYRNPFDITVPPGNYFVMGDNRDNSNDSRFWGFVPEENLIGKLIYVLPR